MKLHLYRQKGIALITALLIIAIVSVTAVDMVVDQRLDIHRTSNILNADQVWKVALGVEAWAIGQLERDISNSEIDHLQEDWALPLASTKIEGGTVSGRIIDLQSKINLNNLLTSDGALNENIAKTLNRLFIKLEIDPSLIMAIKDWIDKDSNVSVPGGAEDGTYLSREPPYRTANQRMASLSELRLMEGFTEEMYKKLSPYLTVLPETTSINVNTVAVEVLQLVIPKLSQSNAELLVDERKLQPFQDIDTFLQHNALEGLQIDKEALSVNSNYFEVQGSASVGQSNVLLISQIHRNKDRGLEILRRSRNTL